jgi:hypothetical protein
MDKFVGEVIGFILMISYRGVILAAAIKYLST